MWLRRDLRLEDNAALYESLRSKQNVLPLFIFDKEILNKLSNKSDARVAFIHQNLQQIKRQLIELGSDLLVEHGSPKDIFLKLFDTFDVKSLYTNHDYEPYAIKRDSEIQNLCKSKGIEFCSFKDQCLFEKSEVTKDNGEPYVVFTPYKNKHLSLLSSYYLKPYPTSNYFKNLIKTKELNLPSLEDLGFKKLNIEFPKPTTTPRLVKEYHDKRNFPAMDACSHLGLHLRFGTISIRKLASFAKKYSDTFLSELIWRDFFMQILFNFPHVVDGPFRKEYAAIEWRNDKKDFQAWCDGQTGYSMVDAGMRELNETGYMHNRVRMLTASFLTKHLLIDWRWGEQYFAEKLLDFELSSNNGNWQWAAGCGCDAAPYFRIFNPMTQVKKFDADLTYIKKWVPELDTAAYPEPIVEHKFARERVLSAYKKALK